MAFSEALTTTRLSMTLKSRSSGDSQTLMDYASKRIQGKAISELTTVLDTKLAFTRAWMEPI